MINLPIKREIIMRSSIYRRKLRYASIIIAETLEVIKLNDTSRVPTLRGADYSISEVELD